MTYVRVQSEPSEHRSECLLGYASAKRDSTDKGRSAYAGRHLHAMKNRPARFTSH